MIFLRSLTNKGAMLLFIAEIDGELKNHLYVQKQVVFSSKLLEVVHEK